MIKGRLACLTIVLLLSACGGSDDDGASVSTVSALIERPTAEPSWSSTCDNVFLGGSPDYPATQWPGVPVTWKNETTGLSGSATTAVETCWNIILGSFPCNPWWSATIPLQLGENRLTVTAAYPGGAETDAILVDLPAPSYSISGKITDQNARGIFNIKVTGAGADGFTFTNADGEYTFGCLAEGSYVVAPTAVYYYDPELRFRSEIDWPFTPASRTVTIAGAEVAAVDFTTEVYRLEGRAMLASNAPTLPLEVELADANGRRGRAAVNGGNFTLLAPNGAYTLHAPTSDMYLFTPATRSLTVSGADLAGLDFIGESR